MIPHLALATLGVSIFSMGFILNVRPAAAAGAARPA
jgi:hypothetical protein